MADENKVYGLAWFVAGLGVGALVGILYAPKSGRETREDLVSGETKTVRMPLKGSDLTYWDAAAHSFVVEPGKTNIMLGSSSADKKIEKTVAVTR